MPPEIEIWNRAAWRDWTMASPGPGDLALAAALLLDGEAMNNGVLHAMCGESLSPEEISAAMAGFRYFGLDDVAELLDEVRSISQRELDGGASLEGALQTAYWERANGLDAAFRGRLERAPGDFAPVAAEGA